MSPNLRGNIKRILLLSAAGALTSNTVLAQQAPSVEEIEVIVVTGSFIEGAAEDAALPVDVITAEDLLKQGSPSMVELVKALPSSQGVFGDSNQFGAGQSTGSSNINLRGLGALRTLVLLNGRRIAPNPAQGVGVDTNLLPTAALERIEVLKDGAAATYGSDAIGGVVNFITRKQEGLRLDGSYSYIEDSDGDYGSNISYGWKGESTSALIAAGYRHRSELKVVDRDWALLSYAQNPSGGWTAFGSPGAYTTTPNLQAASTANGSRFIDPQCEALEGVATGSVNGVLNSPTAGTATVPTGCQFQFTQFDNLVEREEHYQAFGELNHDFNDSVSLHAELLYAAHEVPEENSSPSYGPNQGPMGGSPTYFIPQANPGFAQLLPQLSAATQGLINTAGGAYASGLIWRPLGAGGNPLTGEGKQDSRDFSSYRGSLGLNGIFDSGLSWDVAVTYSETEGDIVTPDILAARLDLALRGLGGPNCTGTTAGANGCLWFNPFSTGVSQHAITGAVNPQFDPASANSLAVIDWMFDDFAYTLTQTLLSVDAVLDGETPIELPGGKIAWAAGAQYRENGFERDPNDISDITVNPCADSVLNPASTSCIVNGQFVGIGPFTFNGALTPYDLKQDLYAVFGELSLPITDFVSAQLAVRYEDYGDGIGDTVDPKLAVRWQITDALALRGSASTTFRAPPATQTAPGFFVGSAFVPSAGGYKAFRTSGNPDLKPETATAFNVGALVNVGGFRASLDYFSFDFDDVIQNESGNDLIARFYQGGVSGCGNPALAPLQARLTFSNPGGACGAASTILIADIRTINGGTLKVSGIDASLEYTFDAVLSGSLTLGLDGTYNLEYEEGDNLIDGVVVRAAADYVGTRGTNGSQPRWKGTGFAEFSAGNHNVRVAAHYIDEMKDTRVQASTTTFSNITPGSPGSVIDSNITYDLHYRVELPGEISLTTSVINLTDEDPSFARLDLSYDPFTGNPIGRIAKIGFAKNF